MNSEKKYFSFPENETILNDLSRYMEKEGYLAMADEILRSTDLVSSSDYFHDFAVELGKRGCYNVACQILERGLEIYKRSVDLLAAYLFYGCDCEGHMEKCNKYYKVLKAIPTGNWTWRCYSFSLKYLGIKLEIIDDQIEIETTEKEQNDLINEYYEKFPNDERPYLSHASLYMRTNPDKAIEILEKAYNELKVCPRCSIRYADLLIDMAKTYEDYQKIYDILIHAILPRRDTEDNYGYIHYLRGICLYHLIDKNNGDFQDKAKIDEIYQCFRIARNEDMGLSSSYLKTLSKYIHILEEYSKIRYDD